MGRMGNIQEALISMIMKPAVREATEKAHCTDRSFFLESNYGFLEKFPCPLFFMAFPSGWFSFLVTYEMDVRNLQSLPSLGAAICWFKFRGPRIGFHSHTFLDKVDFLVNIIPSDFIPFLLFLLSSM